YSRPIQIHPVRLSSNQQWSSDLMRWPLPAPSAPNASGAFCRRSHHHHDLVSSAPFPVSPRRLLRPPPASPWMPSAASTPQGTRCTSSPAAAPHATHSSPSTRSTTTPFRYALLPEDIHTVCTKLGFRSPSSSPPAINQFARMYFTPVVPRTYLA
uniref:Uncharacterized protein n=4 Tax=Aegilops tauschii subsp. strangulata TaxID=200361 RepID=A0A453PX02_AEGTS